MMEMLGESREGRAAKDGNNLKSTKPAKRWSPGRLQFETLEPRLVPAVFLDLNVTDVGSLYLQAACTSSYYEQASLQYFGEPQASPGVSDNLHTREQIADIQHQLWEDRKLPVEHLKIEPTDAASLAPSNVLPIAPNLRVGGGGIVRGLPSQSTWPAHVFAPYIDMSQSPMFDLAGAAKTEGIQFFNLAFIAADSQNRPSWGGRNANGVDGGNFDRAVWHQIAELRSLGGDVAVSFGGPDGRELAQAIGNTGDLKDAYRRVVDAYRLERVDFNLEGAALADMPSVDRRWQAVAGLQRDLAQEGRTLDVWLTLPAGPTGLTDEALNVVRSAHRNGLELDGVNLRTIHDGASAVPTRATGTDTIQSSINAFYQLQKTFSPGNSQADVWRKIGVTPVVGGDHTAADRFTPGDAVQVRDFAQHHGVGMIGLWSLDRDRQNAKASTRVEGTASSAKQDAVEFSDIFLPFTNMVPE